MELPILMCYALGIGFSLAGMAVACVGMYEQYRSRQPPPPAPPVPLAKAVDPAFVNTFYVFLSILGAAAVLSGVLSGEPMTITLTALSAVAGVVYGMVALCRHVIDSVRKDRAESERLRMESQTASVGPDSASPVAVSLRFDTTG